MLLLYHLGIQYCINTAETTRDCFFRVNSIISFLQYGRLHPRHISLVSFSSRSSSSSNSCALSLLSLRLNFAVKADVLMESLARIIMTRVITAQPGVQLFEVERVSMI